MFEPSTYSNPAVGFSSLTHQSYQICYYATLYAKFLLYKRSKNDHITHNPQIGGRVLLIFDTDASKRELI